MFKSKRFIFQVTICGRIMELQLPKPLCGFHLFHHKVQCISKVRTTQNGQHTTCRVFCDLYQTLKLIPVREVIKLLKLIKAETNTPGHYKQSLSGHILNNVSFLRQIKDFYLSRSSEWYRGCKPWPCTFCKNHFDTWWLQRTSNDERRRLNGSLSLIQLPY